MLNIKKTITAFGLLSAVAFGAVAADSIDLEQAKGRQSLGTVELSAVDSDPMDLHAALDKKADEMGASAFRVIEAHEGNDWHVTAEMYK